MNGTNILTKQEEKARIERESIVINSSTSFLVDDYMSKCGYSLEDAINASTQVRVYDQIDL